MNFVPPTEAMVTELLTSLNYLDPQSPVGYAVGVVSPQLPAPFFTFQGTLHDYANQPLQFDRDLRFELASISKVFPSALLTLYGTRNPDLFSQTITSCVPAGLPSLPATFDAITLLNLANYTSGLPEDDADLSVDTPSNLPRPFTAPSLFGFLHDGNVAVSGTGTTYTYSNLAPSLLAECLPTAVGSMQSFGELLAAEITGPLGMTCTAPFTDVPFTELPLAIDNGEPTYSGWDELPAFLGGSGLVTTSNDMLAWLQFSMGMTQTLLNAILAPMQTPSTTVTPPADDGGGNLGIGWFLSTITADSVEGEPITLPIVYKAGLITTASFICFVPSPNPGVDPSPLGMFLLTNNSVYEGGWQFAFQLMLTMAGYPNATNVGLE